MTNGTLDGKGIGIGAGFMLVFTIINILGVRWLAESNSIATYWKIAIPTITIFALLFTVFHTSNFTAGGGFVPLRIPRDLLGAAARHRLRARRLRAGDPGRRRGAEPAAEHPAGGDRVDAHRHRDLPAARGGLRRRAQPRRPGHGWADPIQGVGAYGPYATLATSAGLGWLSTLLIIDSVVSPAGTGLIYIGTSSRLSYGLGQNGYFPRIISMISRRGVPLVSIIICFVVGMLTFLPFPSWAGLVGLVTSATVLMYAMAPLSLAGLRRQTPTGRGLPPACSRSVLCPLAFIFANCIVYFAGWSNIFWLYVFIVVGIRDLRRLPAGDPSAPADRESNGSPPTGSSPGCSAWRSSPGRASTPAA